MRSSTLGQLAIAIAILVHAGAASCQDGDTDELERWVPSFGFSGGIVRQTASGFVQYPLRPPADAIGEPGVPGTPFTGDGSLVDPFVVFTSELMTPGLLSVPGRPRLFAHAEVGGAFGAQVELAKEGAPGPFLLPPNYPDVPGTAVGGQGMKTTLEIGTLIAGGGLGVAFTADLFGRRLRLKPSFEYLRHQVTAEGVVKHATDIQVPDPTEMDPDRTKTVVDRLISLRAQQEETLHSIGGGLELEMDTARLGPFVLSIFANGQAYSLISDRKIELSSSDGTNTATWDVKLDREIYRGSAGLRFRFLPEH